MSACFSILREALVYQKLFHRLIKRYSIGPPLVSSYNFLRIHPPALTTSQLFFYILACSTDYRDFKPRPRIAGMHLPPFHTLGFMVQILYALRSCTTVALYPPVTKRTDLLPIMPTPQNILEHTRRTKSTGIITIPSIIQIWSQDPRSVDFLKSLKFVVRRLFSLSGYF